MKIEIKQSFAIDDKEYKVKTKGKAAVHNDVPAYFCFIAFFISLVKSGAVKILEVRASEFKDLPGKYSEKDISHEDLEMMHDALENADVEQDDESEEDDEESEVGEESEENSNSVPSVDGSQSNEQGEQHSENSEPAQAEVSQELPASQGTEQDAEQVEAPKELSEEEKEFAFLEEKKLRLTNKEKKRHAELKAKLEG